MPCYLATSVTSDDRLANTWFLPALLFSAKRLAWVYSSFLTILGCYIVSYVSLSFSFRLSIPLLFVKSMVFRYFSGYGQNTIFRVAIFPNNSLFTPNSFSTLALVLFFFQLILSKCLQNHISTAMILFSSTLHSVHASAPYTSARFLLTSL